MFGRRPRGQRGMRTVGGGSIVQPRNTGCVRGFDGHMDGCGDARKLSENRIVCVG